MLPIQLNQFVLQTIPRSQLEMGRLLHYIRCYRSMAAHRIRILVMPGQLSEDIRGETPDPETRRNDRERLPLAIVIRTIPATNHHYPLKGEPENNCENFTRVAFLGP
jgi:hypothetical protein